MSLISKNTDTHAAHIKEKKEKNTAEKLRSVEMGLHRDRTAVRQVCVEKGTVRRSVSNSSVPYRW